MKNFLLEEIDISDVAIEIDLIPISNKTSRPQIEMNPIFITVHNTGNSSIGANADSHTEYIDNYSGYISWHFTVDDEKIIQELPINEIGFHAGDGHGDGNRKSIGIEICENIDGDYNQSEENAIKLIVFLIKELGLSIDDVYPHQHWSGKYCPHIILDSEGGFEGFKKRIEDKMISFEWKDIISNSADSPDAWEKSVIASKQRADLEYDSGDEEIMTYLPKLVEKIAKTYYELGLKNK